MAFAAANAASSSSVPALLGATIGASAAIIGQVIAAVAASRRHLREMTLKNREMRWNLLTVAADERIKALVQIYDLVQQVIDGRRLDVDDYRRLRPMFVFLPQNLVSQVITSLSEATGVAALSQQQKDKLKNCQRDLRDSLGLPEIESHLSRIEEA